MHRHLYTLFILASIRVVYAQGFEYDPYKEFCLRSGHQSESSPPSITYLQIADTFKRPSLMTSYMSMAGG